VKEVEMLIDSGADPNAKNKVSTWYTTISLFTVT
jgi:hypothetical protein